MNEILKQGAFEIADKIKSKEISPVEVVQTFIDQAETWQPQINALTEKFYDQALEEARKKEKVLTKTSDLPPLFGVPFSAKEMLATKGARRTAGNIYFKDEISPTTATVIQRMKDAGAIHLGTTNVPELGFWFETDNVIYGRTNNPHDISRTSGGSCGGEAALIAARGSAFGLGSDIGGSIRMPAFFCGIFGHKPSPKMVPLTGHFPFSDSDMASLNAAQYPYTTVGPMAFKARDLYELLNLMKGADGIDPQTRKDVVLKPLIEDVSKIKVYYLENPEFYLCRRADPEVKSATRQAATYLSEIGCKIEPFVDDIFETAVEQWFLALKKTRRGAFSETLSPNSPIDLKKEFFKMATFNGNHTLPALVTVLLEKLAAKTSENNQKNIEPLDSIRHRLASRLGSNAVLILPPYSRVAPKHRTPWFSPFDYIYSGIFNVLNVCSTACPLGRGQDGLPNGVQIVAGHDMDHLSISVAMALESAFGGAILPAE